MSIKTIYWNYKLHKWHRKKTFKLRMADVVLLRYPKSGVTWLRVMVSQIYRSRLGLPQSHLIGSNDFAEIAPSAPKLLVANDNMGLPKSEIRQMLVGRKVIMLVRDPRDIAVSLYFHFTKRATKLEYLSYEIPQDVASNELFAFVMNESFGLPKIIDFMNYWNAALRDNPDALVLRYEDLRAEPERHLAAVMDIISPGTSAEEIERAVAFAAFEKMKEMESRGSFGVNILKPADDTDSDSFKVRRGKIGGYVDYVSEAERQQIDALVRDQLDSQLGYS